MRKYRVTVKIVECQTWIVEAESADEAEENYSDGDMVGAHNNSEEVTDVEEEA
jgi:hypothetical protein